MGGLYQSRGDTQACKSFVICFRCSRFWACGVQSVVQVYMSAASVHNLVDVSKARKVTALSSLFADFAKLQLYVAADCTCLRVGDASLCRLPFYLLSHLPPLQDNSLTNQAHGRQPVMDSRNRSSNSTDNGLSNKPAFDPSTVRYPSKNDITKPHGGMHYFILSYQLKSKPAELLPKPMLD